MDFHKEKIEKELSSNESKERICPYFGQSSKTVLFMATNNVCYVI